MRNACPQGSPSRSFELAAARPRGLQLSAASWALSIGAAIAAAAGASPSRGEDILIRASRVLPVSGAPIEPGSIVVRNGKIAEVGAAVSVSSGAAGVRTIVVNGCVAPGFVDCGSDIAILGRASEEWNELTPEHRALGGVDDAHRELAHALEAGVTAAAVSPGPRNVIGGLGAVIRTHAPRRGESRVLKKDAFLEVSINEAAVDGNYNLRFSRPLSYTFRLPNTRMGAVFLARRAFFEASDSPGASQVPSLLAAEGRAQLERGIAGETTLRVYADAEQEIVAALRIADEFHVAIEIVGGGEAAALVPRLAERRVAVLLDPATNYREQSPREFPRYVTDLPARLARAGVPFAFASMDGDAVELLRTRVAFMIRFGLSEADALSAVTLTAARILRVEDRIGSIEPGKDADLVAFSGDPFDVSAGVLWTMSAGRIDREIEGEF